MIVQILYSEQWGAICAAWDAHAICAHRMDTQKVRVIVCALHNGGIGAHSLHIVRVANIAHSFCALQHQVIWYHLSLDTQKVRIVGDNTQNVRKNMTVVAKSAHRGREGHAGCLCIRICIYTQKWFFTCKPLFMHTQRLLHYNIVATYGIHSVILWCYTTNALTRDLICI